MRNKAQSRISDVVPTEVSAASDRWSMQFDGRCPGSSIGHQEKPWSFCAVMIVISRNREGTWRSKGLNETNKI
jgi:hypothetical protein